MLLTALTVGILTGGSEAAYSTLSQPVAPPSWSGRTVDITPFDLKIMASGFYGITSEAPESGRRTVQQIFDQAAAFQYERDDHYDDWQEPSVTEKLKRGDCEDMAVWVYRELKKNGYENVRIMVGKFEVKDRNHHTWAVCAAPDGDDWIVDPALARKIWKRSDLLPEVYVPAYSFDGQSKYVHSAL